MKVSIITLTPAIASMLLAKNTGNRKTKKDVNFYVKQMLSGQWLENGEAIITDTNGDLRDGQHRLLAVIEANYSYQVPLVEGVDPDVMATLDTGFNRSLSDILHLNGFEYSSQISAFIKKALPNELNENNKLVYNNGGKQSKIPLTNTLGLEYAIKNREGLYNLSILSKGLYNKQPKRVRLFKTTEIAFFIHLLGGFNPNKNVIELMEYVLGINKKPRTVSAWVHNKMLTWKLSKLNVTFEWKKYAVVKSWNAYIAGDPEIKSVHINTNRPLEINKPLEMVMQ